MVEVCGGGGGVVAEVDDTAWHTNPTPSPATPPPAAAPSPPCPCEPRVVSLWWWGARCLRMTVRRSRADDAIPSARFYYQPPRWLWRLAGVLTFSTAHCVQYYYLYIPSLFERGGLIQNTTTQSRLGPCVDGSVFRSLGPLNKYNLAISSYFAHVWLLNIKFLSPSKLHFPYRINLSPFSYHT